MLGTLAVLTLYRSTHRVAEQLRAVATSCDPTARAAADHAYAALDELVATIDSLSDDRGGRPREWSNRARAKHALTTDNAPDSPSRSTMSSSRASAL